MKTNLLTLPALVLFGLLLSGCAAEKGAYSGKIADDAEAAEAPVVDSAVSGSVSPSFGDSATPVDDERSVADSLLQQRLIFFDYDKAIIREEHLPVLNAHADFLLRYTDKGVILGGHTDERGSNEYNLALGQRRADAVRDYLLSVGISSAQLESLSFGEEYPRDSAANEVSWQQNRRVEIRYSDE